MKAEMAARKYVCIVCPNGCEIEVEKKEQDYVFRGNKCKKGEEYVYQELTDPRRTIATTVLIDHAELPLCSVRVTSPIPKNRIEEVMKKLAEIRLEAPVKAGTVIKCDFCQHDSFCSDYSFELPKVSNDLTYLPA